MANEIWTATEEKDGLITFEIEDESTGKTRTEQKYKEALPLMFSLGGYPANIGIVMGLQSLPWRFRKVGNRIYIDGPSVGVKDYHPIDAAIEPMGLAPDGGAGKES